MLARAVIFSKLGGPDVLRVEQVDVPEPGTGELRIKVEAFGLNRAEARFREGWHPVHPVLPSRIGCEASGRIESVGPDVKGFSIGDRVGTLPVMDLNKCGAYGELLTVPVAAVVHNPPELDATEAAGLWSSYMTAYGGIVDLVSIQARDFVLVTAASSSVAIAAIQIVNMLAAKPIAVTRTRAKADIILAAGAYAVIVTDEEDLIERVEEITAGSGVKLIFDPVGGPGFEKLAKVAAPYSSIVLYGVMDPNPTPLPIGPIIQKNLSIYGYAMYLWDKPDRNERAVAFIRDGIKKNLLRPKIGRIFTLDEIVAAASYLDSMQQIGKIVVTTG